MGRIPFADRDQLSISSASMQLQEMRDVHREMARLFVAGWTNKEVSQHFGMPESRVSIIRNSPCFIQHMQTLHEKADEQVIQARQGVRDEVDRLSQMAAQVLRTYLVDEQGNMVKAITPDLMKLQVKVAQDVLDRAGVSGVQHLHIETDEASAASKRQKELGGIFEELRIGAAVATGDIGEPH